MLKAMIEMAKMLGLDQDAKLATATILLEPASLKELRVMMLLVHCQLVEQPAVLVQVN